MPVLKSARRWTKRRWKAAVGYLRRRRLIRPLIVVAASLAILVAAALGYYYVEFSRIIDARLHGERDRVIPRVFARPLTFNTGQVIGERELVTRLNDVGYTERPSVEQGGEFAVGPRTVSFMPHAGTSAGRTVVVTFAEPPARKAGSRAPLPPPRISRIQVAGKRCAQRGYG